MKVYVFSRNKYIEERITWFCENSEKFNAIIEERDKERIKALFGGVWYDYFSKIFKMSKDEYESHIRAVKWAEEYDGEIVDFHDDHGYIYSHGIDIEWCELKEVKNYDHNFKTTKNLYCLHDFMKEMSLAEQAVNKDDLMTALNKFGRVEYHEHNNTYVLYNTYYGEDDIHLIDLENNMCYITALGSWDGRAGGMYFDYRKKYSKLFG